MRVFELICDAPQRVCVIAGNHDEALSYDSVRFTSSVLPSDFADFLNANVADDWIQRAGKVALRLTAHAPRALFFPDGLLVAHGGFPLSDLHPALEANGDGTLLHASRISSGHGRTQRRARRFQTASRAAASSVTRTSRTSAR